MKLHKKNVKDLGDYIYEGILLAEQRNGILIESANKRIYIQFDSIISLEAEV